MDKIRALIVDDSSVMRKIIERSLRQAGLELTEVLEASNGAEALAEVQKGSLDIILSDINMPVMDGLEFLRRLRSLPMRQAAVIIVSTEGREEDLQRGLDAGADGYVCKPFQPRQLQELVRNYIS